jgi:serine/threonine protein phosphatase PrpC
MSGIIMQKLQCQVGSYSDQGLKEENQDSFGFFCPDDVNVLENKGIIAAIADGVSGCDAGKDASACCIQNLVEDYYCTADSWSVQTSVQKVLVALNSWMYGQSAKIGKFRSMATTLTAMVFKSASAHIFHIGDTRVYLLRDKKLQCLTHDHTWPTIHGMQLTRAIGMDLNVDIEYRKWPLQEKDYFIFTTDGVYDHVKEEQILNAFLDFSDLDYIAEYLVKLALQQGSRDNLSCQIVQVLNLPPQDVQEVYQQVTQLPLLPELEAGMKFDGYQIVCELHSSKRGHIYKAIDEASNQVVALKTPSVAYQNNLLHLDLFSHEEWVGKRLNHPNLVKLFSPPRPKHFLYVATEYIEGQTLRQWLEDNGVLSLQDIRIAAKQIALGLQAMHRLEMVHQSINPDNIMRNEDGNLKIIDFGSTQIWGVEDTSSSIESLNFLNTQHYGAPEYFLGQKSSPRSDIFSLGVMVYEMLTGHLPYGEKYPEGKFEKLAYTSVRDWQQEIPVWVDKAIKKAVNPNPDRRYQDILEFVHDLSHPNSELLRSEKLPLIERNPVAFWRGLSIFLLLAELITLANCV